MFYPAGENLSFTTFDANAVYVVETEESAIAPYLGAGVGVTAEDTGPAVGFNQSDEISLNLVGGLEFEVGGANPFVQAQYTTGDALSRFGVSGGLLFDI